jgi:hypothetical protein
MAAPNLPKDFDAEAHKRSAKKFANAVPLRETCDLDDPKEKFLWMLVALPGQNGGQQAMPSTYNMLVSEALHRRGAMLKCEACGHMKEPEEVYVPPAADDPHWMTSPGRWRRKEDVPAPSGDPFDKVLDSMHVTQQAAFLARLQKRQQEGMFDA